MTTPELEIRREIPRDVIQEILLKLPTKDVARSSCVSRLWRDSVKDPSFRELHSKASHVIRGPAEALFVSEKRRNDCNDEAGVFSVSSGKALRRVPIINGYVLANVCNGLLCFAHGDRGGGVEAPVLVRNPATGETMKVPDPPPFASKNKMHFFALGFSPHTNEYKLFRLSSSYSVKAVDVEVYTLGDSAGEWRKLSYFSESRPMEIWAPVLIDGKLYVATLPWKNHYRSVAPERILVVDVSSEMCHTYRLPTYRTFCSDEKPSAFELNGRLCFAVHKYDSRRRSETINFWVMPPQPLEDNDDYDTHRDLYWDLFYSFHMEDRRSDSSCVGWLDNNGMLCYIQGSTLHTYQCSLTDNDEDEDDEDEDEDDEDEDQDDDADEEDEEEDIMQWEEPVDLSMNPSLTGRRWPNIHGGYRPSLLSPLTLQPRGDVNDENRYQLEHAMLSTLYNAINKP